MRAAKLVWSNNGWTLPEGRADDGVPVNNPNVNYNYGLEEFLFNPALLQRNLGYLDCYRSNNIPGMEDVLLFSLTPLPRPRQIIMIGVLRGVRQLLDNEKIQIWNVMQQHNYIENVVNPAFQVIEGFALDEQASGTGVFVENNFGANIGHLPLIQGNAPNGFFVNFQYQKIEIFPKDRWINLTEIDPVVNKAWRRITNLYYVNKRPLIEAKLETIGLI